MADSDVVHRPASRRNYFLWVNVAALVLQAFVVSRIVSYAGIAGVVLALPVVAIGTYGLAAVGVTLAAMRWAKTAENSVDYSIMNTAKQMLWLPTTREEKYKAKQAIDTFFVRTGDLLAAGRRLPGRRAPEPLHARRGAHEPGADRRVAGDRVAADRGAPAAVGGGGARRGLSGRGYFFGGDGGVRTGSRPPIAQPRQLTIVAVIVLAKRPPSAHRHRGANAIGSGGAFAPRSARGFVKYVAQAQAVRHERDRDQITICADRPSSAPSVVACEHPVVVPAAREGAVVDGREDAVSVTRLKT